MISTFVVFSKFGFKIWKLWNFGQNWVFFKCLTKRRAGRKLTVIYSISMCVSFLKTFRNTRRSKRWTCGTYMVPFQTIFRLIKGLKSKKNVKGSEVNVRFKSLWLKMKTFCILQALVACSNTKNSNKLISVKVKNEKF